MHLCEARTVLAERGWLPATPAPFREAILARTEARRFKRGEAIYNRGDPPGGLWGLATGGIAIEVESVERGPFFGHFAGPGFWVGAAPIITHNPRNVGLLATRASVLLHLPMAEFEAIAEHMPQAWRWLAILPLQQTMLAIGIAEDLMIRDPRRRTIALMLRLAACREPLAGPEPQEIVASQENLASIVNLSRTALGEFLRDFERQGLIERRYRRIRIDKDAALKALIE